MHNLEMELPDRGLDWAWLMLHSHQCYVCTGVKHESPAGESLLTFKTCSFADYQGCHAGNDQDGFRKLDHQIIPTSLSILDCAKAIGLQCPEAAIITTEKVAC